MGTQPADSENTAVYSKLHDGPDGDHGTLCLFEHLVNVVACFVELIDLIVLTHVSFYHALCSYVLLYAGI